MNPRQYLKSRKLIFKIILKILYNIFILKYVKI